MIAYIWVESAGQIFFCLRGHIDYKRGERVNSKQNRPFRLVRLIKWAITTTTAILKLSKFVRRLPLGYQVRNYSILFMGQHERSVKMTDISVLLFRLNVHCLFIETYSARRYDLVQEPTTWKVWSKIRLFKNKCTCTKQDMFCRGLLKLKRRFLFFADISFLGQLPKVWIHLLLKPN